MIPIGITFGTNQAKKRPNVDTIPGLFHGSLIGRSFIPDTFQKISRIQQRQSNNFKPQHVSKFINQSNRCKNSDFKKYKIFLIKIKLNIRSPHRNNKNVYFQDPKSSGTNPNQNL